MHLHMSIEHIEQRSPHKTHKTGFVLAMIKLYYTTHRRYVDVEPKDVNYTTPWLLVIDDQAFGFDAIELN